MKRACDSYHLTVSFKPCAEAFLWPEEVGLSHNIFAELNTSITSTILFEKKLKFLNEVTRSNFV